MKSTNQFDYYLPPELIAKQPAVPRDFSRLFVYDTKTDEIVFDKFYNLDKYLPKKSFLVMNDTKVIPARVVMEKVTGGKVRVLFLVNEIVSSSQYQVLSIKQNTVRIFVDRKVNVGERLYFDSQHFITVISQEEHIFTVEFDFSIDKLFQILEKKGTMPIPLYIKNSPLNRDELLHKYQTIFAQKKGSAAAPTASLHFTNRLFRKLEKNKIDKTFITLHVGMGTFAPVTDVNIKQKKLHEEYFEINNKTLQLINLLKQEGKKLVAVGTTVVRTLEAFAKKNIKFQILNSKSQINTKFQMQKTKQNALENLNLKNSDLFRISDFGFRNSIIGKTDLFIQPGFKFQYVDSLITNFHLPGSSLMMLVEAFLQHKTRNNSAPGTAKRHLVDLYKIAIKEKFRFYSFGDGMLIK